jgi:methionyl-tRNA formyltransferase
VVTQPDRQKGRSLRIAATPVKSKAEQIGIKVFQPAKINSKDSIEYLKKFNADLFVVASFGQILSRPVLSLPKLYCLNVHASLLPEYRGAAPINWAVANGDKETGVTIMRMNEKMDEGDIILKEIVPITGQDDAITLSERASKKGANILLEAIRLIKNNEVEFVAQDKSRATYAPKLKKGDGLIDWKKGADEICNRIRAFVPWPGCFTHLDKKIFKIWKARPVTVSDSGKSKPGEILEVNKNGIVVKTGKGALKIYELQLEGSRRMTAEEFIAGHKQLNKFTL